MRSVAKKRSGEIGVYSRDKTKLINQLIRQYYKCPVTGIEITDSNKDQFQIHHKKGRENDMLLDKDHWLVVHYRGHEWIEANPEKAKEFGFSISRVEE